MKRPLLISGIVVGGILSLGPLWGFLLTVFGMMHAFKTLGGAGISDPKQLSDSIGQSLAGAAIGLFATPVGLVLLIGCIIALVKMQKIPPAAAEPPEFSR